MSNRKFKSNGSQLLKSKAAGAILCQLYGLLVILAGFAICAFAYLKMQSRPLLLFCVPYLFLFAGAFVAGKAAVRRFGGRGFLTGALASLPLLAVVLAVLLILGGKSGTMLLLVIPLMLLGGAGGGIVGVNTKG